MAILFPIIFSEQQIGIVNLLITISAISAQFASLGVAGIINFFFPKFKNDKNAHNDFFNFAVLFAMLGLILFTIVFYFWGKDFMHSQSGDNYLQDKYYLLIYPLTVFSIGFIIVDYFSSSTLNSTIGNFYKDIVVRLVITILILLFYFSVIDFTVFIVLYTLNLAIPVVAIFIYLYKQGHVRFRKPEFSFYRPYLKKITSVGLFYILSGFNVVLAGYVDKFMINYFMGLKSTGIYSITNFFGTLTRTPRSSMGKIGAPVIARLFKENNIEELERLLKRSSVVQVMLGVYIFIGIWVNTDYILSLLPDSYNQGKWVIFYISLSNLFFCFIGLGGVMISVSKYYRFSTYSTIVLGVSVVILNYILIPVLGITGAALSTALANLMFVIFTLSVIYFKMKIKILYFDNLKIIISGFVAMFVSMQVVEFQIQSHEVFNTIYNIIIRSIIVSAIYFSLLYFNKVIKKPFSNNFKL